MRCEMVYKVHEVQGMRYEFYGTRQGSVIDPAYNKLSYTTEWCWGREVTLQTMTQSRHKRVWVSVLIVSLSWVRGCCEWFAGVCVGGVGVCCCNECVPVVIVLLLRRVCCCWGKRVLLGRVSDLSRGTPALGLTRPPPGEDCLESSSRFPEGCLTRCWCCASLSPCSSAVHPAAPWTRSPRPSRSSAALVCSVGREQRLTGEQIGSTEVTVFSGHSKLFSLA